MNFKISIFLSRCNNTKESNSFKLKNNGIDEKNNLTVVMSKNLKINDQKKPRRALPITLIRHRQKRKSHLLSE